jgi:hypothetical protein
MKTVQLTLRQVIELENETAFATNFELLELNENEVRYFEVNEDGSCSYMLFGGSICNLGYTWQGITFDEVIENAYNGLVASGVDNRTSDLEHSVRGLLLFAKDAAIEDKINFLNWFTDEMNNGRGLMDINTSTTQPVDHFEYAEGKTWEEMEEVYSER